MNYFGMEPQFYIGDVVYNAGGRCGPRIQTNLQLVYIHGGEAAIWVDGIRRDLGAGEATLLLPGHHEDFRFSTTGETHHGWCEVIRAKLDPEVVRLYDTLPVSLPFGNRLTQLAEMGLVVRRDQRPSARQLHAALAQAIFFEFFSQAGLLDQPAVPLPAPVQRAKNHMERDYAKPCDLALLGNIAGVTPAHLIRLFRQHLDVTPIEFLWRTRVGAASRLLAKTGLSIAEIAYRTGFQSPYHFSRMVRKHLGQSPRQFRQTAWSARPVAASSAARR
jgi:AraC family transcriptional regulator of arabinose operon